MNRRAFLGETQRELPVSAVPILASLPDTFNLGEWCLRKIVGVPFLWFKLLSLQKYALFKNTHNSLKGLRKC